MTRWKGRCTIPLENVHTARQIDPAQCDRITQKPDAFGPGIAANWCVRARQPVSVQSIHFDAKRFSVEQAKKWLAAHDYSTDEFEPATGTGNKADAAALTADGAVMKDVAQCPMAGDCPLMKGEASACATPVVPAVRVVNLAAEGLPAHLTLHAEAGALELQAAASEGGVTKRAFSMVAYTGQSMRLEGFVHPVVVDLAGMKVASQRIPILRQHDPERIIGCSETVELSAQRLKATGALIGVTPAAQEALALAAAGFAWQVSLGADVGQMEFVDRGASAKANGRNFPGPCYIARGTGLRELSLVPMGADSQTSAMVQ